MQLCFNLRLLRPVLLGLAGLVCVDAWSGELPADRERILFTADFESHGSANESAAAKRLRAHRHVEGVADGGFGGSAGIRVAYVGGKRGSERVVSTLELARPVTEATLCFDVFFEEDFQFVRGGKLHGLGPNDPAVGGERVTAETWSARLMFGPEEKVKGRDKEASAAKAGGLRGYTYHQNMRGKYGEGATRNAVLPRGRWLRLCYHIGLNKSAKSKDGFAHLYIDGVQVLKQEGLQFRASDKPGSEIRRFLFHTFHGGSDKSWAPRVRGKDGKPTTAFATVHARFDNLLVVSGRFVRTWPRQ